MVKNSSSQTGSAFAVIIIILIVAIVGALGFVFWQNFTQRNKTATNNNATHEAVEYGPEKMCPNSSQDIEVDGVFCSEEVGVEFKVPEIFKGKFQKAENYDITEGSMENFQGNAAGKSTAVYEAVVALEHEALALSVAREPIRSGYSSIGYALQRTYFNASDGNLHLVKGPANEYDSATDTMKTTGSFSVGESVPSFEVDGVKVYQGGAGDAGVVRNEYMMVVNDRLVIIEIEYSADPMYATTIDHEKTFAELNTYLMQLKFIK